VQRIAERLSSTSPARGTRGALVELVLLAGMSTF
jgi:hypothetical protein